MGSTPSDFLELTIYASPGNILMIRRMRQLALLLGGLALCSCGNEKHTQLWGNETDDASGLVLKYHVSGASSGEPLAGVLYRYNRADKAQPKFGWESKGKGDGSHDFVVNGKSVTYPGQFILFVNDSKGMATPVDVSKEQVTKVFGKNANPSRKDLLNFWDDVVQPQITE